MTFCLFRSTASLRMPGHYHTLIQKLHPFPAQKFQQHLLQLGTKSVDQGEYVKNCIATVKEALQLPEYDFTETGIKKVSPFLELFKEITGEASFMTEERMEHVHSHFKKEFCGALEEKWSIDAAKSFYVIPEISKKEEKIAAAQKWTHHYFCALNHLNNWKGPNPLPPEHVAKFLQKTLHHFREHAHSINEQKFKVLIERMERDPVSFQRIIEKVTEKAEKDPTSLSSLEKEYYDFTQMHDYCTLRYFAAIDEKADLLNTCVWDEYELREMNKPIIESKHPFVDTLKE